MVTYPPFGSPSFKLAAKGLVELHRLMKDGKDDSPEAESVRDALDAPLNALNRTEEERAQWLSEDLYSVSEPPAATTQKEMNPQAQKQLIEAIEARQNGEWDRALALLRRWREYIAPTLLSYLRGSIWFDAGFPDVAAMFYGHASESDPADASYRALFIDALAESDRGAAVKLADEVLADDTKHAPLVVAEAAHVRFSESRTVSEARSARLYRDMIPILERNLARIEKDEGDASTAPEYEMTVGMLGFCQQLLGNSGAALSYFSRGLQLNPNNAGLLTARGTLQYGTSPRAITDFEQAVRLGCPVIWPYLFLAHHYLATSRFEQCRLICETGLRMQGSETAKSQLEEWRAIAQAELRFPPELVRVAFDAALRLDPSNELARRNQDAFEASLRVPHNRLGSAWEPRSAAAVRQFGLAERRYPVAAWPISFAARFVPEFAAS
jgi:tetratricopeptide (TPR) repeat protein